MDHPRFAEELSSVFDDSLPPTFAGFPTRFQPDERLGDYLVMTASAAGRHHIAITTAQRFLELTIGYRSAPETDDEWLLIPEQRLLEFTGGEIFYDGIGRVTQLRKQLAYFPDNVWKYRLSYAPESIGWELGLVALCARRGDLLSMHLNAAVTVKRVMQLTFLLNRRYCPGYAKWLHREFTKLPIVAGEIEDLLQGAFVSRDDASILSNIELALGIIYAQLENLMGLPELPHELPRVHDRGISTIDTQEIARIILASSPLGLRQLAIHGAPYGAADQWITNEDLLLSPVHLKALAGIYRVHEIDRTRFDEMI
jgi:hypothetical protein